MIGIVLMNSTYSCLLIEAVIFIFKYKLSLKGGVQIYLLALVQCIFSYYMVQKYNSYDLKTYIVWTFCCFLEYGVAILIAFMVENENMYLATLIIMIFGLAAHILIFVICSFSKVLSATQIAYVISYEKISLVPAIFISLINIISGYICSIVFAIMYDKLKDKHEYRYKKMMIICFLVMYVTGVVRKKMVWYSRIKI